ncbi:MAG: Di-/tripeptide transporter [Calditrichaeota bacterium]|nr:Di-/tripeptide transporter [Calditrichota bacterium]
MATDNPTVSKKRGVISQLGGLGSNFWVVNWLEANERLAFFGARAILPLYMVAAIAESGLALSYTEKGVIYSVWALIQTLIPMVSGGFTDEFGYKKSLYVAYTINILGYLAFAVAQGFWATFGAACLIGLGTAIFKPPVQGTIAKITTQENSSVAWGMFYWMVNVGGFLAPMAAAMLRGETNWQLVFFAAAGVTAFNFIPTIIFYREPPVDPEKERKTVGQTFVDTITTLKDKNFLIFLAIFSGFWFMFMQLWDLLPNFIDEWVNSASLAQVIGSINPEWVLASGMVKPEIIINIDAAAIIVFMIPIAWLTGKFHPMVALIGGMVISLVGFFGAGFTNVGAYTALFIFIFAVGEMACSPKFSEYIGLTAPPDKKALYMGYSNIPFAVGWTLGNLISGPLYDTLGSREMFARKYMIEELGMSAEKVESIAQVDVLPALMQKLPDASNIQEAILVLWDKYDPWLVWSVLTGIGFLSTAGMVVYYIATRGGGISSNASQ